MVTLPETNSWPLKIGLPNKKVVFQPSIFRGYVSFREGRFFFWGGEFITNSDMELPSFSGTSGGLPSFSWDTRTQCSQWLWRAILMLGFLLKVLKWPYASGWWYIMMVIMDMKLEYVYRCVARIMVSTHLTLNGRSVDDYIPKTNIDTKNRHF